MDLEAKIQYMETLREEYFKASKKGKTAILNEYCKRTGEDRKHAIKSFNYKVRKKKPEEKKKRRQTYNGEVIATLVEIWNIFDRPCGQRLRPLIRDELDKLRYYREIKCSDATAVSLKRISSATIDRRLRHEKKVLNLQVESRKKKETSLLSQVPVKTSADINVGEGGHTQIDCVEHNGASAAGEFINSLTTVDIHFGWWEGEAVMGKGQQPAVKAIKSCRARSPIEWQEMHPDNGDNILNWHVHGYAQQEKLKLSRSRPYRKNDNCFIEQKNSTHVRKPLGYLRFDTSQEQGVINDLFRGDLRLFKNFFQPVMKLQDKTKFKGKQHRKYDEPTTPYHRIMLSDQVDEETKAELKAVYDSLNPAELKRSIDAKVNKLYKIYQNKNGSQKVDANKKLTPSMVSYHLMHQL